MTELSALEILEKLVSFPTVSDRSNLELIDWVESYFNSFQIRTYRKYNLDNTKVKKLTKSYMDLVEKFDSQSKVFTDKAPLNFAWIGIIKILFPNSKIVHCSRNPKDNILSLYKNDFDDRLNFTYDFDDLEIFYKEYLELIDYNFTI